MTDPADAGSAMANKLTTMSEIEHDALLLSGDDKLIAQQLREIRQQFTRGTITQGAAEQAIAAITSPALRMVLPLNWSGLVTLLKAPDSREQSLWARMNDGSARLLGSVNRLDEAVHLQQRLELIAAYAEPVWHRRNLMLARVYERAIINDPASDDEQRSFAKDFRKNAEAIDMREANDPEGEKRTQPKRGPASMAEKLTGREARDEMIRQLMERIDETDPNTVPWRDGAMRTPQINGGTGKAYRGVNRVFLAERINQLGGSADNRWFSMSQIKGDQRVQREKHRADVASGAVDAASKPNGMWIRKGEVGTRIIFARKVTATEAAAEKPKGNDEQSLSDRLAEQHAARTTEGQTERSYFCLRKYVVFHASQLENVPPITHISSYEPSDKARVAHDALVDLARRMGVQMLTNPSQNPHYRPGMDLTVMPPASQFTDEYAYLSTMAHELAHAAGDANRLNRAGVAKAVANGALAVTNPQAARAIYAQEELVAEMSAVLICGALGFKYDLGASEYARNHLVYLKDWKELGRLAPTTVAVAMAQAERVLTYAVELSPLVRLAAEQHGFVGTELATPQAVAGAALDVRPVSVDADGHVVSDPDDLLDLDFMDDLEFGVEASGDERTQGGSPSSDGVTDAPEPDTTRRKTSFEFGM